jgi:hypothetical protein
MDNKHGYMHGAEFSVIFTIHTYNNYMPSIKLHQYCYVDISFHMILASIVLIWCLAHFQTNCLTYFYTNCCTDTY